MYSVYILVYFVNDKLNDFFFRYRYYVQSNSEKNRIFLKIRSQ